MKTKKACYFLFLISFYIAYGQGINDNFENGNILNWNESSNGNWTNSTQSPITGTNSLKHNLTDIAGFSYITRTTSELDLNNQNIYWQFNLKNGNWDPSSGNKFWIYLTANESDLNSNTLDGYAIGVNFSGSSDLLTLWKITNGAIDKEVISTTIDWNANNTKGIKVTRTPDGLWSLFVDNDGGFDNLIKIDNSNIDAEYTFSNYFGLHFTYSATRAGLLWLDDITIQTLIPSNEPTINFATSTTSINETNTTFNIPITLTNYTANVEIDISIATNSTAEIPDYTLNTSSLAFTANGSKNISITIHEDSDFDNETIILNITVVSENINNTPSQHIITIVDDDIPIVINEIYADPDTINGDANGDGIISSTQDEFIEIYNNSNVNLDISGWTLADASRDRHVFPQLTIIPANATIVVFSGGEISSIPGLAQLASSGSLVLNNTGDSISIKNESGINILTETYDSLAGNNQSIAREDDITGVFVQHSNISTNPLLFSPGRENTTNLPFSSSILNTTDIHQNKKTTIFLSSKNELTILDLQENANVKIFSLLGEEIKPINSITYQETSKVILPNLNPGIYIIKIKSNLNELTKKIIIE